ncbi:MAG: hypothetical protein V4560_04390 [Bacteroidota bacterium]|jgi:hypothetical protein
MKHFLLLLLFGSIYLSANAQIKWDADKPLKWSDFSAVDDDQNPSVAYTNCRTTYTYAMLPPADSYKFNFKIDSWFDKAASWVKSSKKNKFLLQHEQVHFDIHELHARKLMQAFKAKTYTANYNEEIKAIYDSIQKEEQEMQMRYDTQSMRSNAQDEISVWSFSIRGQIAKLPPY